MTDHADILRRLEAAKGVDREIDAAIFNAAPQDVGWIAFKVRDWSKLPGSRLNRFHDGWLTGRHEFDQYAEELPRYTASLDAAIALVEKMLPGVEVELTNLYGVARATLHHETGPFYGSSEINSLPIACLLALFRALEAGK